MANENIVNIDVDRVTLYTPAPGSENERASLGWQLTDFGSGSGFNPRIQVWTRVPTDPSKRPIEAALNSISFEYVMMLIEKACDAEPGFAEHVTCEIPNKDMDTGARLPGWKLVSKVVVGKDKEGCIRIAVISADEERPKLSFKFESGMLHHLAHKDGSRYSESDDSIMVAKATVRVLRNVMAKYPPLITPEHVAQRKNAKERRLAGAATAPRARVATTATTDFEDITF